MLVINDELFQIEDSITYTVERLVETSEFEFYWIAKKKFDEDIELQEKIKILDKNKNFIEFRPELEQLQKDIIFNEKVYQLRIAENDVQTLLSEITKNISHALSKNINIDENLPIKKGGHHGHS
ncbi:MAG: YlbF family regulator [Streptococcaceae bacterium]|nr:YlbF family regulator [Streptococcaceae bacterium]